MINEVIVSDRTERNKAEEGIFNIEIKNIKKSYGNVCALNDVNLSIKGNKVFGLLGRNGAGKTTLLNIITNKIPQTSGQVLINSQTVWENEMIQSQICYMPEKIYTRIT